MVRRPPTTAHRTVTGPDRPNRPPGLIQPLDRDDAHRLVRELASSWEHERNRRPHTTMRFTLAGLTIALESTSPELFEQLVPALRHHPTADDEPVLTIRIWSLDHRDARRPRLPLAFTQHAEAAHVEGDRRIRARFDHTNRAIMAWDADTPVAWWCTESADHLTWWEQAAPFRPILSWFLPTRGRHLAHAAAVGDQRGAVLLAGPGGSGKSTTAVACHLAGLGYLGDDYCIISADPPTVHSLYGTAKLRLDGLELLRRSSGEGSDPPALRSTGLLRPAPPTDGKAVALLDDRSGAPLLGHAPVAAIAAIRVGTDISTTIRPTSGPQALMALAPTSLLQLPGLDNSSFIAMRELVAATPRYAIELGQDRNEVVRTVRDLLAATRPNEAGPDRQR